MAITSSERSNQSKSESRIRKFFKHENAVLGIILVAIIIVMGIITRGRTLTRQNIMNVFLQNATKGIAAIGQLFVILTGGIDLSVGGIALVATIAGASMMTGQTGFPGGTIALLLLIGIGIGSANGSLVSRIGMPALIVTLGMWQITDGIGYVICRGIVFRNLPEAIRIFGSGTIAGFPIPAIIFIIIAVIAYLVLEYTTFGRSIYAVGGNPVSAWLSGIKSNNIQFSVYVISGFLGALAGFLIMSRTMCGGMTTAVALEMDSIAAVVIGGVSLMGGRGTLVGAVLGILIMGVINNGMNVFALDPAFHDLVKGAIIIAAVAIDYIRRRR